MFLAASLDWIGVVGIVGTVASVISLVYAVIIARRSIRAKILTYQAYPPLPLGRVLLDDDAYELSVMLRRKGDAESLNLEGAYLHYLQMGNLGREPVRREDLSSSDPLRIEVLSVSPVKIVDVAEGGVSRNAINFQVEKCQKVDEKFSYSIIRFDFLDYLDGALIKVLTDRQTVVRLAGTIVGMPTGVRPIYEIKQQDFLNRIGCGAAILLQISAIAGAVYLFLQLGGTWSTFFPLLPALGVLLLPAAVVMVAWLYLWPKGFTWPEKPTVPQWFTNRLLVPRPAVLSPHSYPLERERDAFEEILLSKLRPK